MILKYRSEMIEDVLLSGAEIKVKNNGESVQSIYWFMQVYE